MGLRAGRRSAPRPLRALLAVSAVAALTALAAVGCSSDDDGSSGPDVSLEASDPAATEPAGGAPTSAVPVEPGSAAEYEAALLSSLRDDPDNASLVDADHAACIAPVWVATITPARFGQAGITPDELAGQTSMSVVARVGLTLTEAEGLLQELGECGVDLRGRALAQTTDVNGDELDAAGRTCLEVGLTPELVNRYAAVSLTGDAESTEAAEVAGRYLGVLQECGVYPAG